MQDYRVETIADSDRTGLREKLTELTGKVQYYEHEGTAYQ